MKRRHFSGVLGLSSAALAMSRARPIKPKYIFLMIGDGMGVAQRRIAERYARMKFPERRDTGLRMNHLPVRGMTVTTEINGEITDSAAAGTALACGVKTINGALGLPGDLSTPVRTVAEDARDRGMKVGMVTDVPIDHATPASFYAKVPKRGMYYEIDEYLARSGFDYFAGEPMLGRKKAKGKIPPEQLAAQAGYRLVGDRAGFDALEPGFGKVLVEHSINYNIEGRPEISLADYTRKGIELLAGDDGFFMMVEGGKIDWSGHANDLASNIHETLSFNDAVEVALDFYEKHPAETLVIVTADHECGGLQLLDKTPKANLVSVIDAQKYQSAHYSRLVDQWTQGGSVTAAVAFNRLVEEFGLEPLSAEAEATLRAAVSAEMTKKKGSKLASVLQKMYGRKNAAVTGCLHEVARRAGAEWTTFKHTAVPVETTAIGCRSELFGGKTDNTDIGKALRRLVQ